MQVPVRIDATNPGPLSTVVYSFACTQVAARVPSLIKSQDSLSERFTTCTVQQPSRGRTDMHSALELTDPVTCEYRYSTVIQDLQTVRVLVEREWVLVHVNSTDR